MNFSYTLPPPLQWVPMHPSSSLSVDLGCSTGVRVRTVSRTAGMGLHFCTWGDNVIGFVLCWGVGFRF